MSDRVVLRPMILSPWGMPSPNAPTEQTVGVYEMLWDCDHCETKKNLGKTHRYCPNCGAPQDEKSRYFPSPAERVAVAEHVFTGVDRECGSCGAPMSAKASNCGQCGAPLDGTKAVPLVEKPAPPAAKGRSWWWIALLVIGVLGLLIWWRCRTVEVTMRVTGHRWTTAVAVEEYREVGEEAWRDQVPPDARATSCRRAQRTTREVAGPPSCRKVERDNGDGTFAEVEQCTPTTRSEPVDDDRCSYRVDRWTAIDELTRAGAGLAVAWADVAPTITTGRGARRAGPRTATYVLELHDGKAARTCTVDESAWKRYADGQTINARVRAASGALVCSSL